ncbi:sugar ABC transporter permease [Lachnotalea sp. AF33-28]|nr:sugar ABC transporter permease [Lachnotalea sp. AF33-28]
MLVPGIVYLIINNYLPMFGVLIAFKKVDYSVGILKSPWAGFSNFTYLFASKDAYIMFRNTILYNAAFILLGNLFGLIVAIALETVRKRFFRNAAQVIILIPYLLSTIIISYIVYAFLNEQNGFMNNTVLPILHMDPVSWYNVPAPWPVILTVVYLWMSIGYTSILYYSTLIGIDKTFYEAAVVDGASLWQQIARITLPCMKKTIIILLILAVGRICYSDFGLFYQVPMHSGLLYKTTQTIDTFVYRALLEQNSIGRSSAAGLFQSVLGFILVVTTNAVVRKVDKESSLF